jgi:cell division protein ZapB
MTNPEINQAHDLKALEEKVALLIQQYTALNNENHSLKAKQQELVREKAKLIEKADLARTRVEAMITRLKSMENGT